MAESGTSSATPGTEDVMEDGNGLLLYQFYPSFYSQRVVFALHEKQLKFKSHVVNLLLGEQFEPSFIKLNPKGEVPVLKDGVKVIPDSSRIIDYLEDNFSNGDTPRLKPEKGSTQYQTMERLNALFDKVPIPLVTYGCLFNPELTEKMKISLQDVKARTARFSSHKTLLEELSEKHKDLRDHYNLKKEGLEKIQATAQDAKEVKKGLDAVNTFLDEIEKELATHEGDKEKWWLCGEKFTIADINVALLLYKLHMLGLWNHYFGDSKHANVANYYKRVQQRDAFRRTIHPNSGILGSLCCLGTKEKLAVSLGSAMIVLGVVGLAAFLVQRRK